MLDDAGSSVYAGANNGLFVWGAQVELGTDAQRLIDDVQNYQYMRTRGQRSSARYLQIGHDYNIDYITAGLPFEQRVSGSTQEQLAYKNLLRAKRSGEREVTQLRINVNKTLDADQIVDLFVNKPRSNYARSWFKLAPYYRDYARDERLPDDADKVRVGSLTGGFKTAPNPFETIAFYQIPKNPNDVLITTAEKTGAFISKVFAETKTIPSGSRYDAARVAGLFAHYNTSQSINTALYTPLTGSTTLYRTYDWYSMTPLSRIARFALGQGDQLGPVIREVFDFTDTLSFTQTYKLPPDYQIVDESISKNMQLLANRGLYSDYYTKTSSWSTTSVAAQTAEVFVNYKDASYFGRRWFQLGPYYNSYTHTYDQYNDYDYVVAGRETTTLNVIQDLATLVTDSEDYQTATAATEDYQVIPV